MSVVFFSSVNWFFRKRCRGADAILLPFVVEHQVGREARELVALEQQAVRCVELGLALAAELTEQLRERHLRDHVLAPLVRVQWHRRQLARQVEEARLVHARGIAAHCNCTLLYHCQTRRHTYSGTRRTRAVARAPPSARITASATLTRSTRSDRETQSSRRGSTRGRPAACAANTRAGCRGTCGSRSNSRGARRRSATSAARSRTTRAARARRSAP